MAEKGLTEKTAYGPSVCEFSGRLYLAWIREDGLVGIRRSSNGIDWPDDAQGTGISNTMVGPPALVVYDGAIRAWAASSFGGGVLTQFGDLDSPWPNQWGKLWEANPTNVSAAVLGRDLVLAWNDGQTFLTKRHILGQGWEATSVHGSFGVPHLFTASVWPPTVMLALRATGNLGPNQIEFWRSHDSLSWEWVTRVGHTTGTRPFGLGATSEFIEYLHRGTDSRKKLNWNTVFY